MTRPRRRWLLLVPVVVLLAGAWLAVTALQARSHLEAARGALPAVQSALLAGDSAAAARGLDQVREDASTAYGRTHDPVWAVAAAVPLLGAPLDTVRGITGAVHGLADTGLPALASVADDLRPAVLRPEPDRLDVQRLSAAAGPLRVAADSLSEQADAVRGLDPSWLSPVADARSALLEQLVPLSTSSRRAATAAELLPPMLGRDGPRTYFVGFQNPAEARGTGGLLGAFALVHADGGRIVLERLGENGELPPLPPVVEGLDPGFVARYGSQGADALWVNANVSPSFPEVARTWLAMWTAGTGQRLDGALAVDPAALSALLRATGPLDVPGLGPVGADRVEPLVLREQYLISADTAVRKDAMVGVGSAVVAALLDGRADADALLRELAPVAEQGHVLVASSRPQEQAQLVDSGVAGEVDQTGGPFAEAVVVNAAGGKLDAYLDTSLDYRVTSCTATRRTVVVTATLRNEAPAGGLPAYVDARADAPPYPTVPGQNRTDLRLLVTRGAQLTGATLDDRALLAPTLGTLPDVLPEGAADDLLAQTVQAGRPSYGLTLELLPGATRTLRLELTEPISRAAPVLPPQQTARPQVVTSDLSACAQG